MSTAISIDKVSKAYRLGTLGARTLQDDVVWWWARVRGRPNPLLQIGAEDHSRRPGKQFWALREVSFDIREGEVLGIVGRNGAGKSTLLKILAQVTAPTSGEIRVRGRIASLLEVGTGFHPELSGRENVYLNGAILGMTKAEIRRKFDEIIAFSECEAFVDTPVKRYSSGMYVRLAFSVAAHLEPETLVVDEVLAVGDSKFQRKCLAKIQSVAALGRTVLFVSHNNVAVRRLCTTGVLLREGRLVMRGDIESVLAEHESDPLEQQRQRVVFERAPALDHVSVTRVAIVAADGSNTEIVAPTEPFRVHVTLHSPTDIPNVTIGCSIISGTGEPIMTSHSSDVTLKPLNLVRGAQDFQVVFDPNYLVPGVYSVTIGATDRAWNLIAIQNECLKFSISEAALNPDGPTYSRPGNLVVPFKWLRTSPQS